jgi:hypothetical protein
VRAKRIDQHDDSLADDLRFRESQVASLGRLVEDPLARPEDHGKDHKIDLVDEVAFDQLLDEPVASRPPFVMCVLRCAR